MELRLSDSESSSLSSSSRIVVNTSTEVLDGDDVHRNIETSQEDILSDAPGDDEVDVVPVDIGEGENDDVPEYIEEIVDKIDPEFEAEDYVLQLSPEDGRVGR